MCYSFGWIVVPRSLHSSLHDALPILIHTDFQKGFIKAEIVSYYDLVAAGSMAAAKSSEEHTSELQSQSKIVCRVLLATKKHQLVLAAPNCRCILHLER